MTAAGEAIDNYLVWQLCKQKEDIRRVIIEDSPGEEELKNIIDKVKTGYQEKGYDIDEKIDLLKELDSNPDYRCKIFQSCSWEKRTVKVEDLGTTLPRLGDIPPEIITGTLSEVVKFVRAEDPEEYRNVKYINNLKEVPEILSEFLPWVINPGNRPNKIGRMNKVHGEKDWDIKDTWGMINDGNHRTIAKILAKDLEKVECYIGYRQNLR